MCNYKTEIESILQCDIFLFSLSDQTFISNIISKDSPDVTAATIRQKLKKLEAGRATAKYIKGTSIIGKDPTVEGVNQFQKQDNPKGKRQKMKDWHKDSHQHSQNHPTKKPFKPNPQQGQPHRQGQKQQKPKSQAFFDPNICKCCGDTRHRPGFNCPLSKFQCKKCQKYGHFTSKCLTKPQSTNVNTIKEVNAVLAFTKPPHSVQAELLDDDSLDAMYICTVNTSKPKRHVFADLQLATQSSILKYLKVRLDTAADMSMISKSVYQQLFDDPQCQKLQPVKTNTVLPTAKLKFSEVLLSQSLKTTRNMG